MPFPGLAKQIRQDLKGALGRTLIRSFFGVSGILALDVCLSVAVAITLARSLGVAGLGVYSIGIAVGRLLTPLLELGMPALLAREINHARARGEPPAIRGVVQFAAVVALGLLAAFVLLAGLGWPLIAPQLPAVYVPAILAGLFLTPVAALTGMCSAGLQGWHRVGVATVGTTALPNGLMLVMLVAALTLAPGWLAPARAVALNVAAHAVTLAIIGSIFVAHTHPRIRAAPPVYEIAAWRRSMVSFGAVNGLTIAEQQLLTFTLGALATETQVGLFRMAQRAAALANLSLMAITRIVGPQIGRSHALGEKVRLQKLVTRAAQVMAALSLAVALGFAALGEPLLELAAGPEFRDAYLPLVILAFGTFVRTLFGPIEVLMRMTGGERAIVRARAIALTLTMIVAVALMDGNAAIGASLANALGLVVIAVLLWRDARRLLGCRASALGL